MFLLKVAQARGHWFFGGGVGGWVTGKGGYTERKGTRWDVNKGRVERV